MKDGAFHTERAEATKDKRDAADEIAQKWVPLYKADIVSEQIRTYGNELLEKASQITRSPTTRALIRAMKSGGGR